MESYNQVIWLYSQLELDRFRTINYVGLHCEGHIRFLEIFSYIGSPYSSVLTKWFSYRVVLVNRLVGLFLKFQSTSHIKSFDK